MKTGKQIFSFIKTGTPVVVLLMLLFAIGCKKSGNDASNTDDISVPGNQAPSIESVYLTGNNILDLINGVSSSVGTEFELDGTDEPVIRDISGIVFANADTADPNGDTLTTSYEYKIEESGTWDAIDNSGLDLRDVTFFNKLVYVKVVTSDGEETVEVQRSFYVDGNDAPVGTDNDTEHTISVGDDSPALPLNATDAEGDAITYDIYKDGALYTEGVSGTSYTPANLPVGTHVFTAVPMDTDAGLEYTIVRVMVSPAEPNPPVVESVVFKSVMHLGLAGTEDHNLGSETVVRDISGIVEVIATITDADDDVVSKVFKDSIDGGNNWNEIAADMDGKYFVDFSTLGGETLLFSVSATDPTGLGDMLEDDVEVDLNDGSEITDDGDFDGGTTYQEWGYSVVLGLPTYEEVDPREGDTLTLSLYQDDSFVDEVASGDTHITPSDLGLGDHDYTVSSIDEYGALAEDSDTATVNVWYDDDDGGGHG